MFVRTCSKTQRSQSKYMQVPCQSYFFVKKEGGFSKKKNCIALSPANIRV